MDAYLEATQMNLEKNVENDEEFTLINDKKFEWGYLRKKCANLELEQFYEAYVHRLRLSSLSLLIVIVALVAVMHSIVLLSTAVDFSSIYMDVISYIVGAILVWLVLLINFYEEIVKRHPWVTYFSSWLAVSIMVAVDLFVPIYHAYVNQDILRPADGAFIVYIIYLLLPLSDNLHAFFLGCAVTASYLITFGYITLRKHPYGANRLNVPNIATEGIFLMSLNVLGIFFRMTKEITIRTTFLDRRQCVEENLLLRYARDQEKNLLLSIIPAQIANKIEQDVKARIERLKMQNTRRHSSLEGRKLFIEPHDDVTVLYADVVNYTYLTTTLDVKTLVETLHDLFVRFDNASEEHNVLRIKFLGDCYYCVAGVPVPNPQHARCCVELGLCMIRDIREVRTRRKLNIDMRIGVHSGSILSGVIGASKWQFDIWSKDVDIANRLEQTGLAGRVHVSEQTLKMLDGEYMYEEGTVDARNDEVLRKHHIHTFLIKPPKHYQHTEQHRTSRTTRMIHHRKSDRFSSNANFMQNTILQYNLIRNQAKLEMSRELDKMPIGRIQFMESCFGRSKRLTQDELEERSFRSNITSMCLFFKNWRWELRYMKEPDIMLKYSFIFGALLFVSILAIQVLSVQQSGGFWIMVTLYTTLLLIGLFVIWYRKLWIMLIGETEFSTPECNISGFLFNVSNIIQHNLFVRLIIYLVLILMYCSTTLLQLADCNQSEVVNQQFDSLLFQDTKDAKFCFNPWGVTESMILIIGMCFLFTRIPFIVKITLSLIIYITYALIVTLEFGFLYERSPSTNVGLYPEYAHLMVLFLTVIVFHLMDRQTEFISKVDFNWKRQLMKKQDDARFTNETIKILIHNILPTHVADIYITKKIRNELYYEEYENVAVMFASIRNYDTDKVGLRVLNEIICDFDDVLSTYKGPLKVEKIKVAGWTYMAACGLDAFSDHVTTNAPTFRNSSLMPNGRRSHYSNQRREATLEMPTTSSVSPTTSASTQYEGHSSTDLDERKKRKISNPQHNKVVYMMTQFALDLMRAMHSFNQENMQYEIGGKDSGLLRIGIANGEIMAGVVGSYKPHYDIWGAPVNMAARMDSTGMPGHIQVTEATANILQTYDIQCSMRGMTYVKGLGDIPTYFVDVDDDLQFVHINEKAMSVAFTKE